MPLPAKGVTIAGNNVLLSDKDREAIGLTTAKVALGDLHRTIEVNARVELPWSQQAMIRSLVPIKLGLAKGKQVEVLEGAFPGDKVVVTGAYLLASLLGNEHKARTSGAKKNARGGKRISERRSATKSAALNEGWPSSG